MYAYVGSWQAGTSANLINNDNATVEGEAGHSVTFGGGSSYYYPTDGELVNFFGFAPQGTESTAAGSDTAPFVEINMTGQEDIMHATTTASLESSVSTPPVFNFAHKLTQLQFTFKAGDNYPATGYSVISLTVNNQPTLATMNVGSGALTFDGSANMQALSTANQSAGITITADPGTNANSPIMTQIANTFYLTIIVKTSGGESVTYNNVPVNLTTEAGNAYMITLTFNPTGINATATVADWIQGTPVDVSVS